MDPVRFDVVDRLEAILSLSEVHAWLYVGWFAVVQRWSSRVSKSMDMSLSIRESHRPTATSLKGSAYHRDQRIHSLELNWFRRVLSADLVTSHNAERLVRSLIRSVVSVSLARAVDGVMGWW